MKNKAVYIIAGPNGSGKTTFAKMFLPEYVNCPNFVNADLIAQGLAPFEPRAAAIKAGKLVLQQIHEYAKRGVDFAFETTLSGKSYVSLLSELREKRYALHLFFLWIPGPELAIARIKDRVAEGGHHVLLKMCGEDLPEVSIISSVSMSHCLILGCCLITQRRNLY